MAKKELDPQEKYRFIANLIAKNGKPDPVFKGDILLEFGELRRICDNKISGLQSILKNMKKEKKIDYRDPMIVDTTVITLVEDYHKEIQRSDVVDAKDVKGIDVESVNSHTKTGY